MVIIASPKTRPLAKPKPGDNLTFTLQRTLSPALRRVRNSSPMSRKSVSPRYRLRSSGAPTTEEDSSIPSDSLIERAWQAQAMRVPGPPKAKDASKRSKSSGSASGMDSIPLTDSAFEEAFRQHVALRVPDLRTRKKQSEGNSGSADKLSDSQLEHALRAHAKRVPHLKGPPKKAKEVEDDEVEVVEDEEDVQEPEDDEEEVEEASEEELQAPAPKKQAKEAPKTSKSPAPTSPGRITRSSGAPKPSSRIPVPNSKLKTPPEAIQTPSPAPRASRKSDAKPETPVRKASKGRKSTENSGNEGAHNKTTGYKTPNKGAVEVGQRTTRKSLWVGSINSTTEPDSTTTNGTKRASKSVGSIASKSKGSLGAIRKSAPAIPVQKEELDYDENTASRDEDPPLHVHSSPDDETQLIGHSTPVALKASKPTKQTLEQTLASPIASQPLHSNWLYTIKRPQASSQPAPSSSINRKSIPTSKRPLTPQVGPPKPLKRLRTHSGPSKSFANSLLGQNQAQGPSSGIPANLIDEIREKSLNKINPERAQSERSFSSVSESSKINIISNKSLVKRADGSGNEPEGLQNDSSEVDEEPEPPQAKKSGKISGKNENSPPSTVKTPKSVPKSSKIAKNASKSVGTPPKTAQTPPNSRKSIRNAGNTPEITGNDENTPGNAAKSPKSATKAPQAAKSTESTAKNAESIAKSTETTAKNAGSTAKRRPLSPTQAHKAPRPSSGLQKSPSPARILQGRFGRRSNAPSIIQSSYSAADFELEPGRSPSPLPLPSYTSPGTPKASPGTLRPSPVPSERALSPDASRIPPGPSCGRSRARPSLSVGVRKLQRPGHTRASARRGRPSLMLTTIRIQRKRAEYFSVFQLETWLGGREGAQMDSGSVRILHRVLHSYIRVFLSALRRGCADEDGKFNYAEMELAFARERLIPERKGALLAKMASLLNHQQMAMFVKAGLNPAASGNANPNGYPA